MDDPWAETVRKVNDGVLRNLKIGLTLESAGDVAAAITEHKRALEIDPELVQVHVQLDYCFMENHKNPRKLRSIIAPRCHSMATWQTLITITEFFSWAWSETARLQERVARL
jgi:hypothetical protein